MIKIALIGTLLLTLLMTGSVSANIILSPDAVINNTLGEWSSTLLEEFMIDQSGLSMGFDSGVTDFDSYLNQNPTHIANTHGTLWGSRSGATSGNVDFDLGSVLNVSDFVLWSDASQSSQFQGSHGGAIKNFNLYASLSADFENADYLGSYIGELGLLTPTPVPAQIFSFNLIDARYIRLEIIDHYGDPNINVSEVAFGVDIPEPATMVLLGLGGLLLRKRRKV